MTYRELIELYKNGRLEREKAEEVEQEIEKHEAISEYLCDELELDDAAPEGAASDEASQDFAKMMKRSIRKAFLKLGVTVFAVTLIAVLFIQFGLPKIVEQRYYNPAEVISDTVNEKNNVMSRDFAVYTELTSPGYYRECVDVDNRGYGNYEIYIRQNYGWNDDFTNIAGKIEKDKLTYYGDNPFGGSLGDGIEWYNITSSDQKNLDKHTLLSSIRGADRTTEDKNTAKKRLGELVSGEMYLCYVTLDKQCEYEDVHQFIFDSGFGNEFWSAVRTDGDTCANLWMKGDSTSSTTMDWDEEKYPYLFTWKIPAKSTGDDLDKQYENINTNENMKTHFLSMLSYLQDQEKFCKMMNLSRGNLARIEKYVRKNGLQITGFAAVMDKDTALDFLNQKEVYTVKAVELK